MRAGLLKEGGQHVAHVGLVPPRGLYVQHRRLQHSSEGQGLARLLLTSLRQALHFVQEAAEVLA